MAIRPADQSPELWEAAERARAFAEADGELSPAKGPYVSPLPREVREKLYEILHDGTYDRAVAAVIAEDPEFG